MSRSSQEEKVVEDFQVRICPFKQFQRHRTGQQAVTDQFCDNLEEDIKMKTGDRDFRLERPLFASECHDGKGLDSTLLHFALAPVERCKGRFRLQKEYDFKDGVLQRAFDSPQGHAKTSKLYWDALINPYDLHFQIQVNNRYLLLELKEQVRLSVLLPEPLYLLIVEFVLGERSDLPMRPPLRLKF